MPADALVQLLNRNGYQAIFLPRTGLVPPEIYTYVKPTLRRRGPLSDYMNTSSLTINRGRLANIEGRQTGGKHLKAAVDFLKSALEILGISGIPKVDLNFAGAAEFTFSFANITYASVDPAQIDRILQRLKIPLAIPDERIETGALHIAYEYAYSTTVQMSRSDQKEFDVDISGKLAEFIDVGGNAKVEATRNSTISFSTLDLQPAAFAYRAGRLHRDGSRWTFDPEVVMRGVREAGHSEPPPTFIAAEDHVLRVLDEPFGKKSR